MAADDLTVSSLFSIVRGRTCSRLRCCDSRSGGAERETQLEKGTRRRVMRKGTSSSRIEDGKERVTRTKETRKGKERKVKMEGRKRRRIDKAGGRARKRMWWEEERERGRVFREGGKQGVESTEGEGTGGAQRKGWTSITLLRVQREVGSNERAMGNRKGLARRACGALLATINWEGAPLPGRAAARLQAYPESGHEHLTVDDVFPRSILQCNLPE
jgi:hypothetical protein